jgi:SpoVK/Ycf46/Vps4 family AAA+-type ATPase
MISFVSDFRQIGGFHRVLQFPPPDKSDRHDIIEILLKVALNTIKQPIITIGEILVDNTYLI